MRSETQWGGLAGIVGGGLGILLTPMFATAYLEPGEAFPVNAFRPALDPLLGFGSAETIYQTYGRIYFLAAGLMFLGFLALRSALVGRGGGLLGWGLGLSLAGWVMTLAGHIGEYWVGTAFGELLYTLSFDVQTLGILLVLIGSLLTGLAARRTRVLSRPVAWSLMLALPLGLVGLLVTGHLPSGPMLAFSVVAIVAGAGLWSGTAVRVAGSSRAA